MDMNRDDIIRMAREAEISFGLPPDAYKEQVEKVFARLERFVALVAAAEREACAKVVEAVSNAPDMKSYAAAIRARGQA